MREIKFRAWESKQNRMDYNPYGDEMICEGTPINLLFSSPMDGQILMQYTGLKDKNGKEIYEGDICHSKGSKIWFKIEDLEGAFCLVPIHAHGKELAERWGFHQDKTKVMPLHVMMCKADIGNLEIIGNIYENPELLK